MNEYFANYLSVLERSEWLRPGELAQFQAGRLASLVQHAYEHAPFYRERLAALFDATGGIDLSRWHEVPVLARSEVVLHSERMRVAELRSEFGPVREVQTSGTLGMPLKVTINEAVAISTNAALARLVRWFGLDPSRALASIRTYPGDNAARYPAGKISKGWIIGRGGPLFALDVATPIEQQLEWLSRVRAPYLLTYPSNAYALAEAVSVEKGRALGLEAVFGFAETVPDGARELIAERFGAPLIPYYSTRETGVIAVQCPATPHYHLAAENVVVELLDDEGCDVPVGERGRVAITSLQNYAMPFIRYAIGDVAVASDRVCPCGRSLPVIERIEGRIRNAFTFRDGTRVWPRGWLAREMQAFVPFRQYQMVQKDFEAIEFRYVPDGSDREPDLGGLTEFAKRMMHPSVEISLVSMPSLPRGPSGKFEDYISLVATKGTQLGNVSVAPR
jgi:phenylacetate-CoA ligase